MSDLILVATPKKETVAPVAGGGLIALVTSKIAKIPADEKRKGRTLTASQVSKSLRKAVSTKLTKTFTQYVGDDRSMSPAGDMQTTPTLEPSAYRIVATFSGVKFAKTIPETDELYSFDNSVMGEVLKEIDRFWELKSDYENLGLLHNRGIMLYGPPGTGKTSLLHQTADMIADRGDVVFYANKISTLIEGLDAFREVEPERKVVVALEDADEFMGYQERDFLQLLDGEKSIGGILYLATTNYLDRISPRLMRPGRFDKKVFVGPPPLSGRTAYLSNKLKGIEQAGEISRLAKATDGMSFGDLRELVTAVYALKEPADEVLNRLRNGKKGATPIRKKDMDGDESQLSMPSCPRCQKSDQVYPVDDADDAPLEPDITDSADSITSDQTYVCSMCKCMFTRAMQTTTPRSSEPPAKTTTTIQTKAKGKVSVNGACVSWAESAIKDGKVDHGEFDGGAVTKDKAHDHYFLAHDDGYTADEAGHYMFPIATGEKVSRNGLGTAQGYAEKSGDASVAAAAKKLSDACDKGDAK